MADRRPLVEGLKTAPPAATTAREHDFVFGGRPATSEATLRPTAAANVASTPISTRLRSDYASALKRASLDRQLKGQEPNTIRDIIEEAIGPWLRTNGYLP